MDEQILSGKRMLVVEDEMMVLMALEDMLADLGCTQVSPAGTVEQALALIERESFDLATLDLNLNGQKSYAVADTLSERGVPFAFSTGYGEIGIALDHRHRPVLNKPFNSTALFTTLSGLLSLDPAVPLAR